MGKDISDKEKELFRNSQQQTRRLKATDKVVHQKPKVKAKRISQPEFKDIPITEQPSDVEQVSSETFLSFQRSGVQPRTLRQLRQGKLLPTATLDLHGLTVLAAQEALMTFLAASLNNGRRVVRLIHGKGHTSKQQYPPLKNAVNQFLRQQPMVLAFSSAPVADCGNGAVYVLLKRTSIDR